MTIQFTVSRNSLSLPSLTDRLTSLRTTLKNLISSTYQFTQSTASSSGAMHDAARSSHLRRQFDKNKFFFIPLAVIVLLLIAGIFFMLRNTASQGNTSGSSDSRIELKKALATQQLNKTFNFPLKDNTGKSVSTIKFTLEAAELRDEIIVKGQRATSVKGRTFLIIPIKITNSYNQSVQINARDYVRLIVNNNTNEKLAPDIHNDPVEVQAISTKQTRLGFPINDTVNSLLLQVGEINGSKENITLTLRK